MNGKQPISHLCSTPLTNVHSDTARSYHQSFLDTAINCGSSLTNTLSIRNPISITIRTKDKISSMSAIFSLFTRDEFRHHFHFWSFSTLPTDLASAYHFQPHWPRYCSATRAPSRFRRFALVLCRLSIRAKRNPKTPTLRPRRLRDGLHGRRLQISTRFIADRGADDSSITGLVPFTFSYLFLAYTRSIRPSKWKKEMEQDL